MYPIIENYKNTIRECRIEDCPVTVEDIEITENIFGSDIYTLKNKTVRQRP